MFRNAGERKKVAGAHPKIMEELSGDFRTKIGVWKNFKGIGGGGALRPLTAGKCPREV